MWVDVNIFGSQHIYQHPTCNQVFRGTTPHDPEVSTRNPYPRNARVDIYIPLWVIAHLFQTLSILMQRLSLKRLKI